MASWEFRRCWRWRASAASIPTRSCVRSASRRRCSRTRPPAFRASGSTRSSRILLARTGDPCLGLDAGRHYHLSSFGLLGALVAVTPTLRDVIKLFVDYAHLTFTFFFLAFEEEGERGQLMLVADGDLGALHRFYLDRDLAFVVEAGRAFWPETWRDVMAGIDFDYPEPAEAARYRALFPCPLRFGATQAAILADFSRDRPRGDANPLGLELLARAPALLRRGRQRRRPRRRRRGPARAQPVTRAPPSPADARARRGQPRHCPSACCAAGSPRAAPAFARSPTRSSRRWRAATCTTARSRSTTSPSGSATPSRPASCARSVAGRARRPTPIALVSTAQYGRG